MSSKDIILNNHEIKQQYKLFYLQNNALNFDI